MGDEQGGGEPVTVAIVNAKTGPAPPTRVAL